MQFIPLVVTCSLHLPFFCRILVLKHKPVYQARKRAKSVLLNVYILLKPEITSFFLVEARCQKYNDRCHGHLSGTTPSFRRDHVYDDWTALHYTPTNWSKF